MNHSVFANSVGAGVVSLGILLHAPALQAATIQVRAGDNLQAAINAAQPGDILMLEAGATFTGNFVLPVKPGSEFVTIRTAEGGPTGAYPSAIARILPTHAPNLAKIRSGNSLPAIATVPGSHHWRLLLLEFFANREGYGEIIQLGDGSRAQNTLAMVPHNFELDRLYIHGDPNAGQKRGIALNAASVTIRNCHISDIKGVGFDTQAIGGWNGPGPFVIENNFLEGAGENLMLGGADPGIPNLVPTGVTVRYNYFTKPMSWREPIVGEPTGITAVASGGGWLAPDLYTYRIVARRPVGAGSTARSTASTIASVQTTAIGSVSISWASVPGATEYYVYGRQPGELNQFWTVTGTSFTDTGVPGTAGNVPTSAGDRWLVKNLFELKNARDVIIEYNIFENNWAHGQAGSAILFTPRNQEGTCTWCVVENVAFERNIVRNVAAGLNVLGWDDLAPSQQTRNIRIRQNLFHGLRQSLGGNAWFLLMGDGPANVVVDHNTIEADGTTIVYVSGGDINSPRVVAGFQFTNNAVRHGDYGINGSNFSFGNAIIQNYFPGGSVQGNWLQGGSASRYPAGNYFAGTFSDAFVNAANNDFTPAPGSILIAHATDGGNIGVDITDLLEGTRSVVDGAGVKRPQAPGMPRILR